MYLPWLNLPVRTPVDRLFVSCMSDLASVHSAPVYSLHSTSQSWLVTLASLHDANVTLPSKNSPAVQGRSHPLQQVQLMPNASTHSRHTSVAALSQKTVPRTYGWCSGGYMVMAATTTKYVFDLQPGDVYWCTADCGWITGHTYLTYGPLLCGAQCVVFEGVPSYPTPGRSWQVVEKYNVSAARHSSCTLNVFAGRHRVPFAAVPALFFWRVIDLCMEEVVGPDREMVNAFGV